jgi:hypothetical protein
VGKLEDHVVGVGDWPITIIDDFYRDPISLVDKAGDISSFEQYKKDFYPGVKKTVDNSQYTIGFQQYADALFQSCGGIGELQCSTYAIANRTATDLLPIQRIPHYDTSDRQQFALVHYLCAPTWGGTAFYRHRSTNIERVDGQNELAFQQALGREATTHGLPPAEYVNGDTTLFEKIGMVEARFNRAIIYPASLLHSGAIRMHQLNNCQVGTMRLTITAQFQITSEK